MPAPLWSRAPQPGNTSRYDPDIADAIVARVEAGESVRSVCRDRAMPSGDTVYKWARREPEFAARIRAAREAADEPRAWRAEQRRLGGWLKRKRNVRGGPPGSYTEALADKVCVALLEGRSLTDVCRAPGMPAPATVYKWRRERPEFARAYRIAREMGVDWILDQAFELGMAVTKETVTETRLRIRTLRWQAARIAPRA